MRASRVLLLLPLLASTALASPALAEQEVNQLLNRADIKSLPMPLKNRLAQMIELPHAFPAVSAFNEAKKPSLLFQYYLIDQMSSPPR